MKCQKCQFENSLEAKFCVKCGNALTQNDPTRVTQPQPVQQTTNTPPYPSSSGSTGKTVVTILTLFFFWPVGLILMFFWSEWKRSTKIAVSIILLVLIILSAIGWVVIFASLAKKQTEVINPTPIENQFNQPLNPSGQVPVSVQPQVPALPVAASKYAQDTDNDSIPDFVEKATGYDPLKDECLLASCGQGSQTVANQQVNVLFILDSSGSMAETAGREIKMAAAKNALKNLAASLPSNINVGLMVYGYKGSNSTADKQISCQSIDMFYPLGPINKIVFNQAVDSFSPTGWTPIGGAFRKAKDILAGKTGKNIVVLISDGIETCGSDPNSAIQDLRALNIQPVVNIVGFGVNQSDSNNLQQLSQLGGGQYFLASDSDKLAEVFANFKKALETLQCNQNSSQAYISCVAKRADAANSYLTALNQSLYLDSQSYQGIQAGIDDSHDAIFNTQTKISQYKNTAGEIFANILQQNSLFLGQQYKLGP